MLESTVAVPEKYPPIIEINLLPLFDYYYKELYTSFKIRILFDFN